MGPRIRVSTEEFIEIAAKECGIVIAAPKLFWQATATYLTRSGDYYYYTYTNTLITLPPECKIIKSKGILL